MGWRAALDFPLSLEKKPVFLGPDREEADMLGDVMDWGRRNSWLSNTGEVGNAGVGRLGGGGGAPSGPPTEKIVVWGVVWWLTTSSPGCDSWPAR